MWHEWQILLQLCYPQLIHKSVFFNEPDFYSKEGVPLSIARWQYNFQSWKQSLQQFIAQDYSTVTLPSYLYRFSGVWQRHNDWHRAGSIGQVLSWHLLHVSDIQSWGPQLWRLFTSTQTNTPPGKASLLKLRKVRAIWDGEISNHTHSMIPLFILLHQITLQHIQT
jgi:uncharacterized protein Usg